MSEPTGHAPGTPSWTDLSSPDPAGSSGFYGELFGWSATEPGPVEETGGYQMFQQDGKAVGGLSPIMQEGQPTAWLTYITVESADDTAAKVGAAGGQTLLAPMDVMDVGRMAIFMDPTGGAFAVWEPRAHAGAEIVNEPFSLAWNELATRDTEAAKPFYAAVFGWDAETQTDGPMPYTMWKLGGNLVGGMIEMNETFPPEVPAGWGVYFAVRDADATAAKAQELGGSVVIQPLDVPVGRMASIVDPQGAFFSVIALSG
jgi:predicted enzyme related to lactoylglutathione lyase